MARKLSTGEVRPAVTLLAFTAVLAAVFALSYLAGSAMRPDLPDQGAMPAPERHESSAAHGEGRP